VAVVINAMSHATGKAPGNVQTSNPIDARRIVISQRTIAKRIRRSVALAAGFGGPIAAVSLRNASNF